jgi:hypothetical protein
MFVVFRNEWDITLKCRFTCLKGISGLGTARDNGSLDLVLHMNFVGSGSLEVEFPGELRRLGGERKAKCNENSRAVVQQGSSLILMRGIAVRCYPGAFYTLISP